MFKKISRWIKRNGIQRTIIWAGAIGIAAFALITMFVHVSEVCLWVGESKLASYLIPGTIEIMAVVGTLLAKLKGQAFKPRQREWAKRAILTGVIASLVGNLLSLAIRHIESGLIDLTSHQIAVFRAVVGALVAVWPLVPLYFCVHMLIDTHKHPERATAPTQTNTGRRSTRPAGTKPAAKPQTKDGIVPVSSIVPVTVSKPAPGHLLNGSALSK